MKKVLMALAAVSLLSTGAHASFGHWVTGAFHQVHSDVTSAVNGAASFANTPAGMAIIEKAGGAAAAG